MSVDSAGQQAEDRSCWSSISSDGRYVAFDSWASNLVPGDTNGTGDIFVRDRLTGTTSRVSVDSAGQQGEHMSGAPSISSDGRYVAFYSGSNLVAGEVDLDIDVFVKDRLAGTTNLVSADSTGVYSLPSISSDGRYVAFGSGASNLVPGDTNGDYDVFVWDRVSGTTSRVSVDSAGRQGAGSEGPSISSDGRYVAFDSWASNLVPGDTNGVRDVFVRDRVSGTTSRVSVDSAGQQGENFSMAPSISSDGRYVAFDSYASNLVPGDTNGTTDVFVRDRLSGTTSRVSVDSAGQQGENLSHSPSISSDGRYVAFDSSASNLVPGDTNGTTDIFVRDRVSGTTSRVSVDSAGQQVGGGAAASISSDGRHVAFLSGASNLVPGDTNGIGDIFVRDRLAGSGTSVPGGSCPVTRPAVVFLVGIAGVSDGASGPCWSVLKSAAGSAGYDCYVMPAGWWSTSGTSLASLWTYEVNVGRVAGYLAQQGLAGRDVIFVGHSMGGIIARAFCDDEGAIERSGVRPVGIVQLGSPNQGSPLANAGSALLGPYVAGTPALAQLSQPYMAGWNLRHTNTNRKVPIYRIRSGMFPYNASPRGFGEWTYIGLNSGFFCGVPNDGAVSVNSAWGAPSTLGLKSIWNFDNVRHAAIVYPGAFGSRPTIQANDIPGTGAANQQLANKVVEYLNSISRSASSVGVAGQGVLRALGVAALEAPPAITEEVWHTLPEAAVGVPATRPMSLEGTSCLVRASSTAGTPTVTLTGPAGLLAPDSATYDTTGSVLYAFQVTPGSHTASLALEGGTSGSVRLQVVDSGPAGLKVRAPTESLASASLLVTACIVAPEQRLTGIEATAQVGSSAGVKMRDDGVAPDATASDGIYAATVSAPSTAGLSEIVVEARGTDTSGVAFARGARLPLQVAEPVASLQACVATAPGTPGGGLGALEIDAGLLVASDATVTLSADLADQAGMLVAQPSGTFRISAGVPVTLTLAVPSQILYDNITTTGTLSVTRLRLGQQTDTSEAKVDELADCASAGPLGRFDFAAARLGFVLVGSSPTSASTVYFTGEARCTSEPIASVQFSYDDGTTWFDAGPLDGAFDSGEEAFEAGAVLTDGEYTAVARILGTGGQLGWRESLTFMRDTLPPETTSNAVPTYVGSASISLFAADALSGVAHTRVSLDGAGFADGTGVTTSVLGSHTLRFYSIDQGGNVEETRTVTFAVNASPAPPPPPPAPDPVPAPVVTPSITGHTLYTPVAPSTVYYGRSFTIYSFLKPRHKAGLYSLKYEGYRFERQTNGTYKWVRRAIWYGKNYNYSTYTKSIKTGAVIKLRGKWRFRAVHTHSGYLPKYSGYRYFAVR